MLYRVLIVGFMLYSLSIPFLMWYCFRQGMKVSIEPEEFIMEPMKEPKPRKHTENRELERMNRILTNIDNYSGDGSNQMEIK